MVQTQDAARRGPNQASVFSLVALGPAPGPRVGCHFLLRGRGTHVNSRARCARRHLSGSGPRAATVASAAMIHWICLFADATARPRRPRRRAQGCAVLCLPGGAASRTIGGGAGGRGGLASCCRRGGGGTGQACFVLRRAAPVATPCRHGDGGGGGWRRRPAATTGRRPHGRGCAGAPPGRGDRAGTGPRRRVTDRRGVAPALVGRGGPAAPDRWRPVPCGPRRGPPALRRAGGGRCDGCVCGAGQRRETKK